MKHATLLALLLSFTSLASCASNQAGSVSRGKDPYSQAVVSKLSGMVIHTDDGAEFRLSGTGRAGVGSLTLLTPTPGYEECATVDFMADDSYVTGVAATVSATPLLASINTRIERAALQQMAAADALTVTVCGAEHTFDPDPTANLKQFFAGSLK